MRIDAPAHRQDVRARHDDRRRAVPGDGVSRRAGPELADRRPQRSCSTAAACSLLRQAAEALAAVHRAGYIHRDICPRNFVVDKDCESLKLIDFGLTVPATPPFMQPGNRTGTPNYMAPEVVRRRPTDQRLDIFCLRRDGLRTVRVRAALAARRRGWPP